MTGVMRGAGLVSVRNGLKVHSILTRDRPPASVAGGVPLWFRSSVKARADGTSLHGIIFPEYALDWATYNALVLMISSNFPEVEFLIAGTSDNCRGEATNIALSTVFARKGNNLGNWPGA
jgi:hypothetical protein